MSEFQFDAQRESGGVRRQARLERVLLREIASCVTNELRDPRIGFVTITRVELAKDMSEAKAFYSLLDDQKRGLAQQALNRARGYVQRGYAKLLRTKRLPVLSFHFDEQLAEERRMNDLIRAARQSDPDESTEVENKTETNSQEQ